MISHYHFDNQLRRYLLQVIAVFYGLRVTTGKGECGEQQSITVPVVTGLKDRVVAAIMAGNTSNRVFSLPQLSVHLQGLSLSPERRRMPGIVDQRVRMPVGGVFPDDLTVMKRVMPVPYDATFELSIYASNLRQRDEILEQILVLFNPDLQLQISDSPDDWTRLTRLELTDISNEENYPSAADRRLIVWTLTFIAPIWLSLPMAVKDDLIRKIVIQLAASGTMQVNEVDADGHLTPFGDPIATIEITSRDPEGPVPDAPEPLP